MAELIIRDVAQGALTANELVQAEQESIMLSYAYRKLAQEPCVADDRSLLPLKRGVVLTRQALELNGKSRLAYGANNNQVTIGLFSHLIGGDGLPVMTKSIATFNHENGEETPAIDVPTYDIINWQWLSVADPYDKQIGVKYLGNGGTSSDVAVINCQSSADAAGGAKVLLTPNIINGQGCTPNTLYKFIQGFNAQTIVRKPGHALESSSSSQTRNLEEETFFLTCRFDKNDHSYFAGAYTQLDSQFGFQARVTVTIKHATGESTFPNVWAYPKMYLLRDNTASGGPARYRDINIGDAGNGGIKFKPKFELMWSVDAQRRGTGGNRYYVHCGQWEEGEPDQYGDVNIDWGPGLHVEFDDPGAVVSVTIHELYAVTDGGEKLLTPDGDGYYYLDDPSGYTAQATAPGPDTSACKKWDTATYVDMRVGTGSPTTWAMKVNGPKSSSYYYNRATFIDGINDAIFTPSSTAPAPENAILAPILKMTNMNPTVKDVAIVVHRPMYNSPGVVSVGRKDTISFAGQEGMDATEMATFRQSTTLPPLPTASEENVSVQWHIDTDSITVRPGEILGIKIDDLPNTSVTVGEFNHAARVYIPFELEE